MDTNSSTCPNRGRLRPVLLSLGALLAATLSLAMMPGSALAHRRPRVTPRHRAAERAVARRHVTRSACRGAHVRIRHTRRKELRHAVVCLIDRERRAHGLPKLRGIASLNRSAQRWTHVMVTDRTFSHGTDFSARISAAGFDWSQIGENIATGYGTPAAAVRAWMRSPEHCQNILDPMFREVGTGIDAAAASVDSRPGTWTLDFGLGMRQRPRSSDWAPAEGCPYAG